MTEIILKDDVEQSKIDALLSFLKLTNIDAEVKITNLNQVRHSSVFSLSSGIWKDYDIKAEELRNKAWKR